MTAIMQQETPHWYLYFVIMVGLACLNEPDDVLQDLKILKVAAWWKKAQDKDS